MVCTLVNAAISPVEHCPFSNRNMRSFIAAEQAITPDVSAPSNPNLKARKSAKKWDPPHETEGPCFELSKQWQACLFFCSGILLCSSFLIVICAVDQRNSDQTVSIADTHSRNRHQILFLAEGVLRRKGVPQSMPNTKRVMMVTQAAFRGLGTIHRKGTKAMEELIVVNLREHCDERDFRLFLRTLYRSGAMASADLALLFPWSNSIPEFVFDVLQQEEESFQLALLASTSASSPPWRGSNSPSSSSDTNNGSLSEFNFMSFSNSSSRHPNRSFVWGDGVAAGSSERQHEGLLVEWGSVVSFKMNDLDPDNILLEFVANPSSQLRRWVCYQMLLGVLRRRFGMAMLVELGGVAVLGDGFALLRQRDGLYFTLEDSTWTDAVVESRHHQGHQHRDGSQILQRGHIEMLKPSAKMENEEAGIINGGRKHTHKGVGGTGAGGGKQRPRSSGHGNHAKKGRQQGMMEAVYGHQVWSGLDHGERERRVVGSRVIVGSLKHVRGLANSMVVEVVRVALHRSTNDNIKHAFPDKALLSYLLQKSPSLLGKRLSENLHILGNEDALVHSVDKVSQAHAFVRPTDGQRFSVLHGNSLFGNFLLGDVIMADICSSSSAHSAPYPDCLKSA